MCSLGEIGPDLIANSVISFFKNTDTQGLSDHDRVEHVHSLMTRAVGDVKADNLMQRISPTQRRSSPLELARWLSPQALVPLVVNEHPQVIALLLVQLDPKVAAEALYELPPETQTQVIHRIATLGEVTVDAVAMLDDLLAQSVESQLGKKVFEMGGPREAAEILNNASKALEKQVMPQIARIDKAVAREIESEMFKFEHLFVLDTKDMGQLLREVENDTLIDALKGITPEQRECFFQAMSSRAADGVRDEIEMRGRMKIADVIKAQKAVITVAKRLAAEGAISLGETDDEFV